MNRSSQVLTLIRTLPRTLVRTLPRTGLAFAAVLLMSEAAHAQQVSSGPYLQNATETSIVMRWRTTIATSSQVRFSTTRSDLGSCALATCVDDFASVTDHEITLTGLSAGTRYFYVLGTTSSLLTGGTVNHFFESNPPIGSTGPTRIWAIGDSGTASMLQPDPALGEVRDAQGVLNSYLSYAGLSSPIVPKGSSWSYLDDGSDQGTAWSGTSFDDSSWSAGSAELGYGDGDESTVVSCGPAAPACNLGTNNITTYFRHEFDVPDASAIVSLRIRLLRDDGAVVYLNDTEVHRTNMPGGAILFNTLAQSSINDFSETVFSEFPVDAGLLVDGTNVLAVEIHQVLPASSDISFDLELVDLTANGTHTDVMLMLGDNAYNQGTDAEYQANVFQAYSTLLRNTTLWTTVGNHDAGNGSSGVADSTTVPPSGPYYDLLTLPTAGEAGGFASGTEVYNSFDVANIHFVNLNSHDFDYVLSGCPTGRTKGCLDPTGPMMTWLAQDLSTTLQDWIVVYFHHPPYTKGTHDSDNSDDDRGQMTDMREVVLPVLDAHGVDLVLTGHSHVYERSFLIDGAYGFNTAPDFVTPSFGVLDAAGHIIDSGDGDPIGDGAYAKTDSGAVYAVVGSSGRHVPAAPVTLDHPVMFFAMNTLGSLVIDVGPDYLDATFIDRGCTSPGDPLCVLDAFTIVKGGVGVPALPLAALLATSGLLLAAAPLALRRR